MSNLIDLGHGLSLSFDHQGGETIRNVWLHFKAQSGKSASISIANFADRNNGIAQQSEIGAPIELASTWWKRLPRKRPARKLSQTANLE